MQSTYKPISSTSNVKEIKVTNELGFEETYAVRFATYVNADEYDPKHCKYCKQGIPELQTSFTFALKNVKKGKNAIPRKQIIALMKTKSIIHPDLIFDHILLGFVFGEDSDPNNHRWWLDFRDKNNQNVYNYFGDRVEINCPITTKSWHENSTWHGRMVFARDQIKEIQEPAPGKLIIKGKHVKSKAKGFPDLPPDTENLRLRYNIREDLWFCDILDRDDKPLGVIPCKNIICEAKMLGETAVIGGKPKVSTKVHIKHVAEIGIAINNLIIKGK